MRNVVAVTGAHVSPLKLDTQKIPLVTLSLALLCLKEKQWGLLKIFMAGIWSAVGHPLSIQWARVYRVWPVTETIYSEAEYDKKKLLQTWVQDDEGDGWMNPKEAALGGEFGFPFEDYHFLSAE